MAAIAARVRREPRPEGQDHLAYGLSMTACLEREHAVQIKGNEVNHFGVCSVGIVILVAQLSGAVGFPQGFDYYYSMYLLGNNNKCYLAFYYTLVILYFAYPRALAN